MKNSLNRKLRKLKNNPVLFFSDALKNKYRKFQNFSYLYLPKVKRPSKKFTIISAVYNVAPYLDDYLKSLEKQRLDFKSNINVILVDDGSLDNSKEIIMKWVKKYPSNIFYIYKKNGGQSSARNLGLKYVTTEWVTFIDPDDFLDRNYFYLIEKTMKDENNIGAAITKFKLFKEKFGTYHDGFQTDFCFTRPVRIVNSSNFEDCVQFSSSSSIYQTKIIRNKNIEFDENLTASFEDTKFFYEYLFALDKTERKNIAYIKDALYYYRLRENESSSSNSQWTKKAKYQQFFTHGVLDVINLFKKKDTVPEHIQRLILFSIIPYLQVASINKSRIEAVLNKEEIQQLLDIIKKCLQFVDRATLEKFYTSPGNYFWISAISKFFYGTLPNDKRVYVNKVDVDNNLVYFRFYGEKGKTNFNLWVNDKRKVAPFSEKVVTHKIFDELLIHEFNVCFEIPRNQTITFSIDGDNAKIYSDFKLLQENDTDFYNPYIEKMNSFKNTGVFVDSGYKADDNAEHLYRSWFINPKNKPNLIPFYLLDKKSEHWHKLKMEGFNLVDINSLKAIHLLKNSNYIFSSYLPGHLGEWIKGHNFKFQKFIFLQHGVVTSNLSKPFNAFFSQIYRMVVSSPFEYQEICGNSYNYIYHKNDILLSGIPRFDSLLKYSSGRNKKNLKGPKNILVCPTWRSKFNTLNLKIDRHLNDFLNSEYLKYWFDFLKSEKIVKKLEDGSITITFCPHLNFYNILEEYNLLEKVFGNLHPNIKIENPRQVSYQNLFLEHDLLITDYSSLHFDFAILRKPVIYYQFDREQFYGLTHAYQPGSFDFVENGFGPLINDLTALIKVITTYANRGTRLFKKYDNRVDKIFPPSTKSCADIIKDEIFG
ncbi:CDP-glycerol:glycerophosphate glycerophosphotransferase [Neisseria sp. CCUG12390]|uniref:CDP-glycerol:glycerophosphate glycerophosphotransferase n=1 Tax=Neisseria sp. CCUG12390 TaxID=3392035 RepID=UPI003A0FFEC8